MPRLDENGGYGHETSETLRLHTWSVSCATGNVCCAKKSAPQLLPLPTCSITSILAGLVRDEADDAVAGMLADLDLAAVHRDITELREVEAAATRLRSGSFGVCISCGAGVPKLRAAGGAARGEPLRDVRSAAGKNSTCSTSPQTVAAACPQRRHRGGVRGNRRSARNQEQTRCACARIAMPRARSAMERSGSHNPRAGGRGAVAGESERDRAEQLRRSCASYSRVRRHQ